MWHEKIREGFDVFLHDGGHAFGAVREVSKSEIVVYIENGGDFRVPLSAVKEVESEKVVLDRGKLAPMLLEAIQRAHVGEDPRIP
jgi:hypothetical protein